MTWKGEET
jgi:hypothetical protein